MATKSYTLKLGEAILMRESLSTPGWATTVSEIYNGGKLIDEVFNTIPTTVKSRDDLDILTIEVKISDSQMDSIKKAIKNAAEKGYLVPSSHTTSVIELLGLNY